MGVILLGKIKIYEIAKKLGLASKEVLEAAEKLNIEVKSHMSGVGEEEAKITLFLEDQGNNFHYYRKKNSGEKSA